MDTTQDSNRPQSLMITCSSTGEQVSTGIEMHRDDFERVDFHGREVGCPACGETHLWSKADVTLG